MQFSLSASESPLFELRLSAEIKKPYVPSPRDRSRLRPLDRANAKYILPSDRFFVPSWDSMDRRRYRFRLQEPLDVEVTGFALGSIRALIEEAIRTQNARGADWVLISILPQSIAFGCIKLKVAALIMALGVAADISSLSSAISSTLDGSDGNIRIECSIHLTNRQALGRHLESVIKSSGDAFSSEACLKVRQRALAEVGLYNGAIDGRYDDETELAEESIAKALDIPSHRKEAIYMKLATALQKPD